MPVLRKNWLRLAVHLGALVPLVVLVRDYFLHHLTFNPIQEATQRTGKTALILLILSLVCSPANRIFGFKQSVSARRPLGLYAFFYASIHVFIFFVLDYGLVYDDIIQAVTEKPYVIAGLSAFLLLAPLALTSTRGWMRRLGKRWKKLHQLVYLAAPVVILHFVWSVKADIRQPLLYGVAVALLLVLRLPRVRAALPKLRSRRALERSETVSRSAPPVADS